MPVMNDRQSKETDGLGRGEACGGSMIAGNSPGGAPVDSAGGNAGGETTVLGAGAGDETTSGGLDSADVSAPTAGDDGGKTGMVSVRRWIRSGIASEPINTTVHAVMCACGFRTLSNAKASQTMPPSARDRSADSTSNSTIATSLVSPSLPCPPVSAIGVDRASRYPPCR